MREAWGFRRRTPRLSGLHVGSGVLWIRVRRTRLRAGEGRRSAPSLHLPSSTAHPTPCLNESLAFTTRTPSPSVNVYQVKVPVVHVSARLFLVNMFLSSLLLASLAYPFNSFKVAVLEPCASRVRFSFRLSRPTLTSPSFASPRPLILPSSPPLPCSPSLLPSRSSAPFPPPSPIPSSTLPGCGVAARQAKSASVRHRGPPRLPVRVGA